MFDYSKIMYRGNTLCHCWVSQSVNQSTITFSFSLFHQIQYWTQTQNQSMLSLCRQGLGLRRPLLQNDQLYDSPQHRRLCSYHGSYCYGKVVSKSTINIKPTKIILWLFRDKKSNLHKSLIDQVRIIILIINIGHQLLWLSRYMSIIRPRAPHFSLPATTATLAVVWMVRSRFPCWVLLALSKYRQGKQ